MKWLEKTKVVLAGFTGCVNNGEFVHIRRTEFVVCDERIVGVNGGAVVDIDTLQDSREWLAELRGEREGLRGCGEKNTRRMEQLDATIAALDAALKATNL